MRQVSVNEEIEFACDDVSRPVEDSGLKIPGQTKNDPGSYVIYLDMVDGGAI